MHLNSSGLGVGLAVCRKIVSAHYGTIRVDPRPGEGTTFTMLLPVQQPSPADSIQPLPPISPADGAGGA